VKTKFGTNKPFCEDFFRIFAQAMKNVSLHETWHGDIECGNILANIFSKILTFFY
jgi:hypothetical protein